MLRLQSDFGTTQRWARWDGHSESRDWLTPKFFHCVGHSFRSALGKDLCNTNGMSALPKEGTSLRMIAMSEKEKSCWRGLGHYPVSVRLITCHVIEPIRCATIF